MAIKTKKKVVYITGTRADFGLMVPVLHAIKNNPNLELKIFATGMHLMPEFGETVQIVEELFPNTERLGATFDSDERIGAARFCGKFTQKIVEALMSYRPDIILVLGDRPEMLCAALAGLYLGIPVAHVHGGDKSSTVDDSARHAITKFSSLHFTATKEAAQRVKKMGEEGWRIHTVGAPALDVILNTKLPGRNELFKQLHLDPKQKVILVTQHPVSEDAEHSAEQMLETLSAVKKFNLPAVVILPDADAGGRKMMEVINKEENNPLFRIFSNLEYSQFLALEREAAVWVGNSSAMMIESPSFHTPVVNVGKRQLGRLRGKNVIDADYDREEITRAIKKSLDDKRYIAKVACVKNPWGDGKTGPRIAIILEKLVMNSKLLNKQITY